MPPSSPRSPRRAGCWARRKLTHSYPHSWRSKAPLIFRNTPQWFISMETNELRKKALAAIDDTVFVPPQGRNRLYSMIESRPDWCISRQRAWGVPIAVFVDKQTGEPLRDPAVVERIAAAFEQEGADAWFASPPARFLGNDYDPDDYEQVTDIVDVWFESGSTHSLRAGGAIRISPGRPRSISRARTSIAAGSIPRCWKAAAPAAARPIDAVLTHGFVLDEQGRKMSKSLGNVVAPQDVMKQYGADILRIWVVASDYSEDLRIGPEILKHHAEAYRRLRNTLRYLLGALDGFAETERLPTRARCRRWSAGCCTGSRSSTARSAAPSTTTTSTATSRRCTISAPSISRPSISTCARMRSIATGPTRRAGAPAARCWISSSPA